MISTDKPTKFVVLSTQRSGSSWLIDILNRTKNTTAYGEQFFRQPRKWEVGAEDYPRYVEIESRGLRIRPFSVYRYLDKLYAYPGAAGFKLMYSQVQDYPEILYYLYRNNIRIVHLIRSNFLNRLLSSDMVKVRQQAHQIKGANTNHVDPIQLDPETLMRRLKRLQKNINTMRYLLRFTRMTHIEISYEDLCHNPKNFDTMWRFLEVNQGGAGPQSELAKIIRNDHREIIANYEDIQQLLTGTEFANMLSA